MPVTVGLMGVGGSLMGQGLGPLDYEAVSGCHHLLFLSSLSPLFVEGLSLRAKVAACAGHSLQHPRGCLHGCWELREQPVPRVRRPRWLADKERVSTEPPVTDGRKQVGLRA